MYIDKLNDIANKYNNTYHRTIIKMRPVDVSSSTYIDFNNKNNTKDLKFKVGDNIKILEHKITFAKDYVPNWSEEILVLQNLKLLFHRHLMILKAKKFLKHFTKRNCKIQIEKSLELKK